MTACSCRIVGCRGIAGALSTIAGARAERVHERSLIDASMALVVRDAHGHIPLALSAATVVSQEPHVVDAAVSPPVAVGAQHRPRLTDAEARGAPGSRASKRLVLRDARDTQRDV